MAELLPELERRDQRPDVIVGTSVGAINAAYLDRTAAPETSTSSRAVMSLRAAGIGRGDPFSRCFAPARYARSARPSAHGSIAEPGSPDATAAKSAGSGSGSGRDAIPSASICASTSR